MSIKPSKKKLQSPPTAISYLNTLNSVSHLDNHPYTMVIQILHNLTLIRTPSKLNHKNMTQVKFSTPSTASTTQKKCKQKNRSNCQIRTKLNVLRVKMEVRWNKISSLSDKIAQLTKYRLNINKCNLQILISLKQIQQIKKILIKSNDKLQETKQVISQIQSDCLRIDQYIIGQNAQLQTNQQKLAKSIQNYTCYQQKYKSISLIVDSHQIKNNELFNNYQEITNKFNDQKYLHRFTKQLFFIMVLITQINNCHILNKNDKRVHKKNSQKIGKFLHQQIGQKQCIVLCDAKSSSLKKFPISLIVLCHIHMYMKYKNIGKTYLNKISFFCAEAQSLFHYDTFCQMVSEFFTSTGQLFSYSDGHQKINEQITTKQQENLIQEKSQAKWKNCQEYGIIDLMINKDNNCSGILTQIKQQNLLRQLLFKYYQIQIQTIASVEGYSKIKFVKEYQQMTNYNENLQKQQDQTKNNKNNQNEI